MLWWNKLVERQALMDSLGNDESYLATVVELFKQQSQDTIKDMKNSLDSNDTFGFSRAAHDLKNIGRSVASNRIVKQSLKLEELAAKQNLANIAREVKKTEKLLAKALEELIRLCNKQK